MHSKFENNFDFDKAKDIMDRTLNYIKLMDFGALDILPAALTYRMGVNCYG